MARTITLVLPCILFLAGCDSLNLQPTDELAADVVWEDPALSESYLNDVYALTGHGYDNPILAGLADDANHPKGSGSEVIYRSNMTPTNLGKWARGLNPHQKYHWDDVYSRVRDLNTFLENVEGSEVLEADIRETLLGEAYFLRAWFYFHLMRVRGGLPLIDETFELGQDIEDYHVPRSSFEETVDFIISDLNSAVDRLPLEGREPGTASRGAALALKCRVRVHAASDLFDADKSPFNMEEVKYTDGSQEDRWQAASNACQEVIDLGEYSLEQTNTPQEYHELFTKGNERGTIWARYFNESGGGDHNISMWMSPNGYRSWGTQTPTQQHVDAYENADGSEFEWEGGDPTTADEPVEAENPYELVDEEDRQQKRDPRFYANVLYNGAEWRPRPEGVRGRDPRGVVQTGWYEDPDWGGDGLRPGLDTREGPIEPWNGTRTAYYFSKFVDRDIEPREEQAFIPWIFMRYAEVLLNKAEAEANLGNTGAALRELNKVRERVGMPEVEPGDLTAERTLMDRIRRERQIELVLEEFRYFDIRRWMIAPEVHKDGKGIRIIGEYDPDNGELLSNHRYNYKYQVITIDEREWRDKAYFLPIPQSEMEKNPELVQNPGYN